MPFLDVSSLNSAAPSGAAGFLIADPHELSNPDLDCSLVDDALPADIGALLRDHDVVDCFVLDARMRAVVEALHQTAWQTGRLLRLFLDRRLFLRMGFRSASRYLREPARWWR